MKPPSLEQQILEEALSGFHRTTGLNATSSHNKAVVHRVAHEPQPFAFVDVAGPGGTSCYAAVVRNRVDRAAIALGVRDQFRDSKVPPILVAPYVTAEVARVCREHELAFMDCAGNVFLNSPGTFVFVVGQKPGESARIKPLQQRSFGGSGIRIIYNCLAAPEVFQSSYREIARASGTALGTVSGILTELRAQGLVAEDKNGKHYWVSKERVVQAWMTNYPLVLRPKLVCRRYRARDKAWWKKVNLHAFGMQWGGEVAAAKLTAELVPRTVTIYAHEPVARFIGAQRLRADPTGDVEILDAFWPAPATGEELVSPLLIYADLMAIADPRTIEIARRLHDEFLA